jgi:hypothetical protein
VKRPPHDPTERFTAHECAFARENLEAHALNALDSFDRSLVDHHLRWCDDCRDASAGFERVTASLPFAGLASEAPSAATWASILNRLDSAEETPQLQVTPSETATTARRRSPWQSVIYPAIIAPLVIALVVMGAWVNSLTDQATDRERQRSNEALISSSIGSTGEVQMYSVQPNCPHCDGVGQVGVSEHNRIGMLVGSDFDPSETHDVWGIDDSGEKLKFCSLVVESNGEVLQMFIFPSSPSGFSELYITNAQGDLSYVSHLSPHTAGDDESGSPPPADERNAVPR